MFKYLTKTGTCDKTSPCEAERLTPASRQNSLNVQYLNFKIVRSLRNFFSHRLRKHNKGVSVAWGLSPSC